MHIKIGKKKVESMKVAIMGAGLAGLACAITLEQHGIEPTVFEKRDRVGDRFINGEILLSILERPIYDSIAYLGEKHGIFLHPISNISKLILYSEKEEAHINGFLGFSNLRGRHKDSFENQLVKQVKGEIIYNSTYTYDQLMKEFTHVIMATGDAKYAIELGNYRKDFTVTLKGVTVEGDFLPNTVAAWLNNDYAPRGYGYLIPFSKKEAHLVIAYPEYPENREKDPQELWEKFYQGACMKLEQNLKITDNFEVSNYIIGICKEGRIGNTFFTGNCFGSIMPFLGFGQLWAILTGIYAAQDLCGIGSYEEKIAPFMKSYENSLALRRGMEKLDNRKFDLMVKALSGTLGEKLFNSGHHDPLKVVNYLIRPFL